MKVIGLCGGSGSGKSTVGDMFRKRNIPVLDADGIYHSLIDRPGACTKAIADMFGHDVLTKDGAIDRRRLAAVVFADDTARKKLNAVTHRFVLERARADIRALEGAAPAVVFDAPLLFESGFDKECDLTVCVTAPAPLRVKRIVARDGISPENARRRMDAQIPDDELVRLCDDEIKNDGNLSSLEAQVDRICRKISE